MRGRDALRSVMSMEEKYTVTIGGKQYSYVKGTTFEEIAADFQHDYKDKIVLALVGKKLTELFKKVKRDCTVEFETLSGVSGHKTYKRSACLLLVKAFYDVLGLDSPYRLRIEFSIGQGYYCTISEGFEVTDEFVSRLNSAMRRMVEEDMAIAKIRYHIDEAFKIFEENHMPDKRQLFKYRRSSYINMYSIGDFKDYYYGYMVPSTGYIKHFEVYKYKSGLLLQLPKRTEPDRTPPLQDYPKLFECMKTSNEWGTTIKCDTVGALNDIISSGRIRQFILLQEALQESRIGGIAAKIKGRGSKFVMIAGPSSSGKTTFSHRISVQLMARGLNPRPIALDDYFLDRDKTPLDKDGNKDYESLEALDVQRFNEDMTGLLEGKEVQLPRYNFITGMSENGSIMKLGKDDILVLEGIHGLNDKLSYTLPRESKYKIYLSALTTLNIDEHNRIPTTDNRLIRRMVRDHRTRGASASRTLGMWNSVRRGEDENIFPFQEEADAMFNSALIYELAVLKIFAEPLLFGIPDDDPNYQEAVRLLKFLQYFLGVNSEDLPNNSLIREFIGGSIFNV